MTVDTETTETETAETLGTSERTVQRDSNPRETNVSPLDTEDVIDAEQTETTEPEQPETFPREYVEKLRRESAGYRDKAKRVDEISQRLHTSLVAATGRLADPSDLPYDEAHLDDEEALTAAVDALLASKPHLASRKPMGDVGQGASGEGAGVSLSGLLRAGAA